MTEQEEFILDKLCTDGYFVFSPNLWDEYGEAIETMTKDEIISTLCDEGYDDMNTCYFYVPKGDPNKIRYSKIEEQGVWKLVKTHLKFTNE